jgi:hypothetical protein
MNCSLDVPEEIAQGQKDSKNPEGPNKPEKVFRLRAFV